ncbi:DUF3006 domain-containing protein [Oceanobacillus sp. CF4.6]|uniref:DUF3006 domain-containing protein n=1 Tax=Oceanobacillus sp. CF4.6 TaxID=3373080 RepID=UPI003EE47C1C
MAKYTIDRFEGNIAVLLLRANESEQIDVPRDQLPASAKEGDILDVQLNVENKVINASILEKETETAKRKAENLLQKILNKNKQ